MASVMNLRVKKEALDDQGQEKHEKRRNFSFCGPNKTTYSVCGRMNQPVLEALRNSDTFNALFEKNQGKCVIIERKKPHHADIATHFPCCLLEEGEKLTTMFGRKTPVSETDEKPEPEPELEPEPEPEKLVTFYVARKGGENLKGKPLLKHTSHIDIPYLCIYAYLGEEVKDALVRDGRFSEIVFGRGIELSRHEEADTVEMRREVTESLNGNRFSLTMSKPQRAKPSDSKSTTAKQAAGPSPEQGASTPRSKKSVKAKSPADVPGESSPGQGESLHEKPPCVYRPVPGSEGLLQELRDEFKDLLKSMMEREKLEGEKEAVELLRQEFGRNIMPLWRVQIGRLLMKMSKTVCYIRNNKMKGEGTGFRLFDRFVLTNAHLIRDFSDIGSDVELFENLTDVSMKANFSFEQEKKRGPDLAVKRVVFGAFGHDEKMGYLDYALLELNEHRSQKCHKSLLMKCSSPPLKGGVCIIGHPDGGMKKFDFCSIIKCERRAEKIEKHITEKKKYINLMNWDFKIVAEDSPAVTYDTCFYHGASGSPVFGVDGDVFAMHSGGYPYKIGGRTMSVIEYAFPLNLTLEHLLENLKSCREKIKREANDPLQNIIAELDKLMEKNQWSHSSSPISTSPISTGPISTPPYHLSH